MDDEPLATKGLKRRLEQFEDVEVIKTCRNGRQAIQEINAKHPDLVFLDIQMPRFDAFDVIKAIQNKPPLFVLVTAFSDHALKAFEAHVVDYLLKPVDEDRLAECMERVRKRLNSEDAGQRAVALEQALRKFDPAVAEEYAAKHANEVEDHYEKVINIRDRGQIFRVEVEKIEYIEAAGDYLCIHTEGRTLIQRETMKDMEQRLNPSIFKRVHRSYIVNMGFISEVKPRSFGGGAIVLKSGANVKISRSYRDVVTQFL